MRTKKYPAWEAGQQNNSQANYSTTGNIGEFRDAILESGFQSVPEIVPGKIHRFPGVNKKPSNRASGGWWRE